MSLRLPPYQPLPPPDPNQPLVQVPIAQLQPTQMCVGLAEVRSRQLDFSEESGDQRRRYLRSKPVPLVRNASGLFWMMDRHHRLRGLIELAPESIAFGYIALEVSSDDRSLVLEELERRGWLYLHDGRGLGPLPATALPSTLHGLQDDPYRSLVWKLKKEGCIEPEPLIPFHEFRWGAWLRSRSLPPFSSTHLDSASHLAGWKGAG